MDTTDETITIRPIGMVQSPRHDTQDDHWGAITSHIELDAQQFSTEAVIGLSDFSHIEVIFFMHLVSGDEIETGARHPRGQTNWPRVGIFAQRAKMRPNRLGISRCRLLQVDGLTLTVQGLDASDGTPIIDIKPYMVEFGPIGAVVQPAWATELMTQYFDE